MLWEEIRQESKPWKVVHYMAKEAGLQEQDPISMNWKELEGILKQLSLPRYGSITIIIHAGRIVQIERCEKFRMEG